MKYLITILLVTIGYVAGAQTTGTPLTYYGLSAETKNKQLPGRKWEPVKKSDTLVIDPTKYKFIKLGDKVYSINFYLKFEDPTEKTFDIKDLFRSN